MKKIVLAGWSVMILVGCTAQPGKDELRMSNPQQAKGLLLRIVGEWNCEVEAVAGPDLPPQRFRGTESGRMVGDWAVIEGNMQTPGGPVASVLTLGYDPGRGSLRGTWICSSSHDLVLYEGTVDASGRALTLDTEAPNPSLGGKMCRYRETIEVQGEDRKVFTSMIEMDGKWITFLTARYQRKR